MTRKKVPNGSTPAPQESISTLELLCDLTAAEHTEKADALAKLDLEINADKEANRADATARREALKVKVETRDVLAKVVDSHKEMRMVECISEVNFERNTVTAKRRDNGEHVSERAMEGEERAALVQQSLIDADERVRADA